jgi:hypothetical protein
MPPAVKTDYITTHAYYVKGFDPDGRVVLGNPWGGPARDLHVTAEDYSKGFTNPVGLQVKR